MVNKQEIANACKYVRAFVRAFKRVRVIMHVCMGGEKGKSEEKRKGKGERERKRDLVATRTNRSITTRLCA